ncbi:FecR domain-containing protein [Pseudomonas sp. CAN2814]|uniref:FecR domain-containing protein n=1 Tax=Pseudomonas sp. CAN1 TaxID=3046726 RepID=UPI0026476CE0|nr:FecR domain-containing protein [Pseudomonas sp. CAN1]MDN6859433.1 FecR domain-containing protein [Pseudomonas sp. CAN1]
MSGAGISAAQLDSIEQAADWFSLFASGDAVAADREAWQRWLDASPHNGWAWQQAERLQQRLRGMPGDFSGRVFGLAREDRRSSRRTVLKGMLLALGTGALGLGGYREFEQGALFADYHSTIGERLPVTLADGSQLLLNTRSALDVAYAGGQCRVTLRSGEVLVNAQAGSRLSVATRQGDVRALGGRFSVRQLDALSQVEVFSGQVQVQPRSALGVTTLGQGQACLFSSIEVASTRALDYAADAWSRGLLIANDQRLADFLADLARYHPGLLRCDPQVADLRLSGTFELDDPDQTFRALASALPVHVERRTRFWITVVPA